MLIGHGAAVAVEGGAAVVVVVSDGVDDDDEYGERYCCSVARSGQQRLYAQTPFDKKA